jgi:hypothetical protein
MGWRGPVEGKVPIPNPLREEDDVFIFWTEDNAVPFKGLEILG